MKNAQQITGLTVTFEVADEDAAVKPETWVWPESVPRVDDIIEHDGNDFRVLEVRWSTADTRMVKIRVQGA